MPRRICVITGSRADYGLLRWVVKDLLEQQRFDVRLIATGSHLAPEFGCTVGEIEADGVRVDWRVEMLLSSDTAVGVATSVGIAVTGFATAFAHLKPDVVLLLGDRFEILAAATAALIHGCPIAHIAGGDVTEGAFDESIRHAITKMSHLHFVTNEPAARRVLQMGEDASRVFVVGSPGLDELTRTQLLSAEALEGALGAKLGERNLLVTFHPATREVANGRESLIALLQALETMGPDVTVWFTLPNGDPSGRAFTGEIVAWAKGRERVHLYESLGHHKYLSLMAQVDVVVGNSSSGLYEAPALRKASVNIGRRQAGRLAAPSVIDCEASAPEISAAIRKAVALDCREVVSPYGDGRSSARIVEILGKVPLGPDLLAKGFHTHGA